jgi:hypothetical protein
VVYEIAFLSPSTLQRVVVIAVAAVAILTIVWLGRAQADYDHDGIDLQDRFMMGIPWGTVLTVIFVIFVYLFLQDGLTHWRRPITIPFRAWSYFYPLGMLTAAFTHNGPGHLLGNLFGTLAVAPLAEYAWGHFPNMREAQSSSTSLRTNPYARMLAVPGTAAIVGIVGTFFGLGPVIGFSGVVFAFVGFAVIIYPLGTALALIGADALRVFVTAVQSPTLTAGGRSAYLSPWWADIAIQGHALGLLMGVLLALALVRSRQPVEQSGPGALRLWVGVVLVGIQQSLWAVYWYRGGDTYVLYRAVGVALVVILAVVVTVAVITSITTNTDVDANKNTDGSTGVGAESRISLSQDNKDNSRNGRWQVAAGILLITTAAIAGPAIPYNLYTTNNESLPGDAVVVEDYELTYAEGVENGLVSAFDLTAFGETTTVTTSGVIVQSADRDIWTTAVSAGRLAFTGQSTVSIGGLGWRTPVHISRNGWTAGGNGTAYRVNASIGSPTASDDVTSNSNTDTNKLENQTVLYLSDPVTATPRLANKTVTIVPQKSTYELRVNGSNQTQTAPLPTANNSVNISGLQFERVSETIYVSYDQTRIAVFEAETYN